MVTSQMSQRHTDVTGAASDANVAAVAAPGAAAKEAFIHFYWCEDPCVYRFSCEDNELYAKLFRRILADRGGIWHELAGGGR
jgi:hypothetical protein